MNKHSKSLLLSLLIHSIILAAVLYTYTNRNLFLPKTDEKRICIKLGHIQQTKTLQAHRATKSISQPKLKPKKNVLKKTKPPEKKVKKCTIKKKRVIQKKVKTKEAPITTKEKIEKVVQNRENSCKKDTVKEVKESVAVTYTHLHIEQIAKLLQENLYYPRRARKRGIEGEVVVRFTVEKNAEVTNITIISSGNAILSRGAIKTLKNLSGLFPKPEESVTLNVPIKYSLH